MFLHPALLPLSAIAALGLAVTPDFTQAELEELSARIGKQVEELRGDKFKRPVAVSVADKAGFIDYAKDRMDRTTTEDQLWADDKIAKLLALFDPKEDLLETQMTFLESQVGGFYDPETESFALMKSFDGGLAKIILAHELTHALDDQLFDIDGKLDELAGNADAQLAFHAVVEGSGTATMGEWTLAHLGEEVSMEEMQDSADLGTEGLEDAPAIIWRPTLMVYMRGASFLKRSELVMDGQNPLVKIDKDDLIQAFTNPPRSTEQVLHPDKYWDEEERDEPKPVAIDTRRLVEGGWNLVTEETMGEALIALATASEKERGGLDVSNPMSLLTIRYTNRAAEGWGGDRYVLLTKDGQIFFRLSTVWDTEKDADQFYERMNERDAEFSAVHRFILEPETGRSTTIRKLSITGDKVTFDVLLGGGAAELNAIRAALK